MAFTLNTSDGIIDEARWMLNDRAASDNLASYDRMKHIAHQKSVAILERIGYEVKTKTVALVVGTGDYVLTAGETDVALYSVTTDRNWPLTRVSWTNMINLRFVSNVASGEPLSYATYENSSGELAIALWPTPNRTGASLNCYYSSLPNSVNSSGDGFTLEVAGSVGYLIAKATALEVLSSVTTDILKSRGLDKQTLIPLWQRELEQGIRDEVTRRNRQSRTGYVVLGRRD